ncbi:hypothetical protein [Methylocystis iwaonis]|uniref:hypothetical protein n=1 Tax=Methylocystis iwaonis TaxID=2885079 RepID=UPI00249301E7|nr:hypothetical protein [Methylocystis iwaonis]
MADKRPVLDHCKTQDRTGANGALGAIFGKFARLWLAGPLLSLCNQMTSANLMSENNPS